MTEKKKVISIPLIIATGISGIIAWCGSAVATALSAVFSWIPLVGKPIAAVVTFPIKLLLFPAKIAFFILLVAMVIKFILALITNRRVKKEKQELQQTLLQQKALVQQQQAMMTAVQTDVPTSNSEKQLQSMKSFD